MQRQQTDNRDTLELVLANQKSQDGNQDGKITIDSTGFQELFKVSNAPDEEVRQEIRIQAQNLMERIQA